MFQDNGHGVLKKFGTKDYYFMTHATKQVLTYKEMFSFTLAREGCKFLQMLFRSVKLNLVHRFLIYAMVHKSFLFDLTGITL